MYVASSRDDDVVYATGEDVGLPLAAFLRLGRRARPRVVMRLEQIGRGRSSLRRAVLALYEDAAMSRVDLVLCRTRALLQFLHSVVGVPAHKLRFVPETVDLAFFSADSAPVLSEDVPDGPFVFAAGLELRDYPTLLAAAEAIPACVVIAAGSHWSHGGFEANELPPNVRIISTGPAGMRELYRHCECAVVPLRPSLRSCGISVMLEAWAMARPVVATATAGLIDYVHPDRCVTVPAYDSGALASGIRSLLSSSAKARRLAANGRAFVQEELSLDRYVSEVSGLIIGASENGCR
jgi:glycosyltransferase involved in cell wall biosynthesis